MDYTLTLTKVGNQLWYAAISGLDERVGERVIGKGKTRRCAVNMATDKLLESLSYLETGRK